MSKYISVYKAAEAEQLIQRSRFIAHVSPVETYEEAQNFVASVKEKYKDATHNVPAIIIGEKQELKWTSDDGEPQGTSGPPILRMLADEGLTNVALVVTRYFGGIKLGTGGLVRAYSSSAKMALQEAGLCIACDGYLKKYKIEYSQLARIQNLEKNGNFDIIDIEYADKVTVSISFEKELEPLVSKEILDATAGSCQLLDQKIEKIRKKIVDTPAELC